MTQPTAVDPKTARIHDRIELVATILLAFATVLTAWSAFESTKWSGTQAIHFAKAGALRTDSVKASDLADAEQIIDVEVFTAWVAAVFDERTADPTSSMAADGSYEADPTKLSGFLYSRFRDEFVPAVETWLLEQPIRNMDASSTPFALPEYQLAARAEAERLDKAADAETALARRDNQRGDNYVMATVLFASVLFFAGVSSKLGSTRNRLLTIGLAVVVLLVGLGVLLTFPVQV